ncbi:Hypothetical protein, putative [Bodo saltans]|uniref:Uncharacterized protein n=1 Tax=Bodo saltans TaxID=75058 RepID=A0A0S4KHT9_BODSA|nr:Hypothetical protein, putative [Bodo saltans]|eukprot:CUI11283.1 Hypothetical protein, putative [Bodo saltans]
MASTRVIASRLNRFTHELHDTCHTLIESGRPVHEDSERDILRRLHRFNCDRVRLAELVQQQQQQQEHEYVEDSTAASDVVVSPSRLELHEVVRFALERIFALPPCDIDLLLVAHAPDLGLLQWNPWSSQQKGVDQKNHQSSSVDIWIRQHNVPSQMLMDNSVAKPLLDIPMTRRHETLVASPSPPPSALITTSATATTASTTSPHVSPPPNNHNKKDAIVDEVRRSIDVLKHNAGRLQVQITSDDATLLSNEAMMDKALRKTTKQSGEVARINNESGSATGALASIPGGSILAKIPGFVLLWGHVLLPLWA